MTTRETTRETPAEPPTILRAGFLVAICAAMSLSAWSLYWVARHYGQPRIAAGITSAGFDGVAIAASGYAILYAAKGERGALARGLVLVMAGVSAFLNAQHAVLLGDPRAAVLLYAAPPVAVITLLEVHLRWKISENRPARARKPRPVKAPTSKPKLTLARTPQTRGDDVREWARGAGFDVGRRGPIPAEVREGFEAAKRAEVKAAVL